MTSPWRHSYGHLQLSVRSDEQELSMAVGLSQSEAEWLRTAVASHLAPAPRAYR